MQNFSFVVSISIVAALFGGCNRRTLPEGMPPLQPLTLTVTRGDAPLPEATVVLYPEDGSENWTSGGKTDANGSLVVYTRGRYPGIPAGKYRVTVDHVTADVPRPKIATIEEYAAHARKHPPFRTVPKRYTSAEETPLTVEVVKGTNRFNLEIPEKVREKIETSL